jgi:hypothetical protein
MMQGWDNRNDIYLLPIIPKFQHSIIPCRRHKTSVVKNCMISITAESRSHKWFFGIRVNP